MQTGSNMYGIAKQVSSPIQPLIVGHCILISKAIQPKRCIRHKLILSAPNITGDLSAYHSASLKVVIGPGMS